MYSKHNLVSIFVKTFSTVLFVALYFYLLSSKPINMLTFVFGIWTTLLISVIVHEIAHFLVATIIGLKNFELEISVLRFKRDNNHFEIGFVNNKIFHGSCSCDYNSNVSLKKYTVFCLIGGFSNFTVFVLALVIIFVFESNIRIHLFCQAITSLYDFCVNCLNQNSSDICLLKSLRIKTEK